MNTTHLYHIILGLGTYFFPVTMFSREKCAMCRGTRKLRKLKVICYASCMNYINWYLASFPVAKSSNNILKTELNEILFNGIPNEFSKQAYMKDFDCETITKKLLICFNARNLWKIFMKVLYNLLA